MMVKGYENRYQIEMISIEDLVYKGLAQVSNWVRLKFATMNLKKLAKWKWKNTHNTIENSTYLINLIINYIKPCFA